MEKKQVDKNTVFSEVVEVRLRHRSRRTQVQITHESTATDRAEAMFVIEEHDQEEPTSAADIKFRITDMPPPAVPSEHAEVNFNLTDGEGRVRVPGRFAGQLLDGCVTVGCAFAVGFAAKWAMEAGKDSLQGWIILGVVTVAAVSIGLLRHRGRKR